MSGIDVTAAARNNAALCDAVCRTHGAAVAWHDTHWITRDSAPTYYPNLVTLDPGVAPAMGAVRELRRARPAASWAVKDSYDVLPLAQEGFRLLFKAQWIVRPTSARRPSIRGRWFRAGTEPALAEWEEAWGETVGQARVFRPALLERDDVAFLGVRDPGGVVTAGVVVNRAANALGISNLFAHGPDARSLLTECVDAASEAFPRLPLVGYAAGPELAASHALGFSSLGPLAVWVHED